MPIEPRKIDKETLAEPKDSSHEDKHVYHTVDVLEMATPGSIWLCSSDEHGSDKRRGRLMRTRVFRGGQWRQAMKFVDPITGSQLPFPEFVREPDDAKV